MDKITHEALYFTLTNVNFNLEEHINMVLKVGEATIKVMDLLDRAHTDRLEFQLVQVTNDKIEGKANNRYRT